jgi:hypothetical protein
VASKNINNGEIPEARTAFACSVSEPLEPVQEAAVGGGALAATVTVADWLALPPVPVQVNV